MSAFERLLAQIDGFIRKFYKNQIIKGIFLFVGVLVATYLMVVTLEYFGRFNSWLRAGLFFTFLGVNIYILVKYIATPLMKLKSYGSRIDRYQASVIIGEFFPDVSDRLLNTLQLNDQINENSADFELLNASVQQRSSKLQSLPFSDAIDIKGNRKYLKFVLPLVLVLFIIGIFAPSFFKQGTERVINFSKEFKVPAPFTFSFLTEDRTVEEGRDFNFQVELVGTKIPDKVYVKTQQGTSLLKRISKNKFEGSLRQLRKATSIQFKASDFDSDEYRIDVIQKSTIAKLEASLVYPSYLGLQNETIENASDLVIPEGTIVKWSVLAKNASNVSFKIDSSLQEFDKEGFTVTKKILTNSLGTITLTNRQSGNVDTSFFNIDVIRDQYPSISVEEQSDTLKDGVRYFSGIVGDDHGIQSVSFIYEVTSKNGTKRKQTLPVNGIAGTESPFEFAVDFRREKLSLEDRIEYFFVVRDNDGVNGSKSSTSRKFVYRLPGLEELNDQRGEDQEKLKSDIKKSLTKVDEFRENLDRLRKELRDSKQTNWNNINQAQQLQQQHEDILQELQSIQEEMNNSMEEKNQLSEVDEELLEKQEMINDLLEELMDDELRDLLNQLEELLKQNDREQLEENLDDLEMSSEDMKKQLDRSMEMLKRLQVNEKVDDIEEELKKLAEEQQELKEDIQDKKLSDEDAKKKQEEINKKFEDIKEDVNKLDSLNSELSNPLDLGKPEDDAKEISQELNDSKENLDKGKEKKAQESQQNAADQMKQMADKLDANQQASNQQQQSEDIESLRNILESLVTLSLDQEGLISKFQRLQEADPSFRKYSMVQRNIVDETKVVADSLNALAERQPKIAMFIDKELNAISENHKLALTDIDEFQEASSRRNLAIHQQYVMTSYNNLALMLNESLQQMQQQMKSMMPGSGSCDKPGGSGQPKPGQMPGNQDMKDMLKKQLEQMQKGSNPGGKKPGDKPGQNGEGGMNLGNKEIAKMAAQQAEMRKRLEQMRRELNKDGKGLGNQLNPLIEKLEEQERELVNKNLNDNLINRQKEILTRLLESEKALMERGWDEKRESKEGKNQNLGNQIQFDQYNKEKLRQIELLRSVDPKYKQYYKDRANQYFNRSSN